MWQAMRGETLEEFLNTRRVPRVGGRRNGAVVPWAATLPARICCGVCRATPLLQAGPRLQGRGPDEQAMARTLWVPRACGRGAGCVR